MSAEEKNTDNTCASESCTLAMEYFKSLREEIHLRIAEHTRLVWIKLAVLGAVISFLSKGFYGVEVTSPIAGTAPLLYVFWSIPLVAIVFDVLIAGNLRVINNLGHYIKKYIEGQAFHDIRVCIEEYPVHKPPLDESNVTADCGKKERAFGFWEEKVANL